MTAKREAASLRLSDIVGKFVLLTYLSGVPPQNAFLISAIRKGNHRDFRRIGKGGIYSAG